MLIDDLLHSCSNADVARAAVACVGGDFAERVSAVAHEKGVDVGRFVAIVVREFARRANRDARGALNSCVAKCDQPVLIGLVHVVEPALAEGAPFMDDEVLCAAPGPAGVRAPQWGHLGLH